MWRGGSRTCACGYATISAPFPWKRHITHAYKQTQINGWQRHKLCSCILNTRLRFRFRFRIRFPFRIGIQVAAMLPPIQPCGIYTNYRTHRPRCAGLDWKLYHRLGGEYMALLMVDFHTPA